MFITSIVSVHIRKQQNMVRLVSLFAVLALCTPYALTHAVLEDPAPRAGQDVEPDVKIYGVPTTDHLSGKGSQLCLSSTEGKIVQTYEAGKLSELHGKSPFPQECTWCDGSDPVQPQLRACFTHKIPSRCLHATPERQSFCEGCFAVELDFN
ncbi:hypothetical protein BJ742DRAFT_796564, partial [Cladochytrium replicatum]